MAVSTSEPNIISFGNKKFVNTVKCKFNLTTLHVMVVFNIAMASHGYRSGKEYKLEVIPLYTIVVSEPKFAFSI